jgi:hypothetical protein
MHVHESLCTFGGPRDMIQCSLRTHNDGVVIIAVGSSASRPRIGNRTRRNRDTSLAERFEFKISFNPKSCEANPPNLSAVHSRTSAFCESSSSGRELNTFASTTACAPSGDSAIRPSASCTKSLSALSNYEYQGQGGGVKLAVIETQVWCRSWNSK